MIRNVSVKVTGDINRALKLFKRKVNESGHIQEYRDRQEYIKPSTKKRRVKQKAIYLQNRKNLEERTE